MVPADPVTISLRSPPKRDFVLKFPRQRHAPLLLRTTAVPFLVVVGCFTTEPNPNWLRIRRKNIFRGGPPQTGETSFPTVNATL